MQIEVFKSKIHRAKVTQAELHYVGSITLDESLMDAADLVENEKVQIVNVNNGERFETYVIPGPRGSGAIELNGATARLGEKGDLLTIMSFANVEASEAKDWKPQIILLGAPKNKILRESEK